MPRGKTTGELIGVRCQPNLVAEIDDWRRKQPDLPSRAEAMRRLIVQALKPSDTQKLSARKRSER